MHSVFDILAYIHTLGEWLQMLAYTRHQQPLSKEGSSSRHAHCHKGPRVCGLVQRNAQFREGRDIDDTPTRIPPEQ